MVKRPHTYGKKKLCDVLQKEARFMAVKIEVWMSKAVKSFTTYTAHFIDGNWSLQSYVLATQIFNGRHTAENVKEHLCIVVKEFVPLKRYVCCVVHDEAANIVAAGRHCMKRSIVKVQYVQLTCFKHVFATHLTHHSKFKGYFLEQGNWLDISITVCWLQKLSIRTS